MAEKKLQRRSKSFSGCYTCRRRKIACDLGKPSCLKCKKSGFVCEGYDVKLRWIQSIQFDKYGYQLPSKPNQETEYCQRRSIEYVKYPEHQTYRLYDEMDADLGYLHNMPIQSKSDPTIIKGHFGVFRGTKLIPKKRKRKANASGLLTNNHNTSISTSTSTNNTYNKSQSNSIKRRKIDSRNTSSANTPTANTPLTPSSYYHSCNHNGEHHENGFNNNNNNNNKINFRTLKDQSFMYPQNVSNSIVQIPNYLDSSNKQAPIGNEWLSTELLDAALLTASALNGDTHFLDMFDLENQNLVNTGGGTIGNNNHNHNNDSNSNSQSFNTNNGTANMENDNNTNSTPDNLRTTNSNHMLNKNMGSIFNIKASSIEHTNSTKMGSPMKNSKLESNANTFSNNLGTQKSQNRQSNDITQDHVPNEMLHMLFQGRNSVDELGTYKVHKVNDCGHATFQPSSSVVPQNHQEKRTAHSEDIYSVLSMDKDQAQGITPSSIEHSASSSSPNIENHNPGIVPTTNLNNKFKQVNQPIVDNKIKIHASNGVKMPKNIMEILENTPLPKSLAIDKFGIPTTSLNVHPMARYLLNYYIEDVADMMTVIPLAKNPWKFIYFPRAIMAIGELASLGRTSNARNGLLNALLAVSAFNLQSKFVRGSDEMKYYVDLGIQLRRQANEFVGKCMQEDILNQKYKDVLVAVLSMVTIDVVWGTMSSCKIHLDHCEKIIEKKMQHKKKLSSKAIILHRIFSSLKLIQDSTSLENIQKNEIFLNENNYMNFLTGSKPTIEQLDELNSGQFRGIFRSFKTNKLGKTGSHYREQYIDKANSVSNLNKFEYSKYDSQLSSKQNTTSLTTPGSGIGSTASNNKRGKYNEKITDNGKVRIEFIVNNDDDNVVGGGVDGVDGDVEEDHGSSNGKVNAAKKFDNDEKFHESAKSSNVGNESSNIPAFVDITRNSFQPSKNKLDDKVVSSDAIYGLPNSLILMFSEIVPLTRFKKYHDDHNLPIPDFFEELSQQLEFKLLTWKLEWTLVVEDDENTSVTENADEEQMRFISPRHEGIYHHVMSFYHALVIYFYRFIEDINPMYLLERIEKVLHHLNKIQEILENNKETSYIIPLFWQGFIAGSEAMTLYLQNGFNKWGQDIAQTGIGTYWNARQIMLEIWRRKNHNVKSNSWVDVLRDWKTNVMLT